MITRIVAGARRLALLAAFAGAAASTAVAQDAKSAESAAPYVPTPWVIVDAIMDLASVRPDDFVVDLGSGDGRLVIAAVSRRGARGGLGVDIDRDLVRLANDNAKAAGVADRVRFEPRDLFATPVDEATLVTLYLLPSAMPRLETKLLDELHAGARVIAHDYGFPAWRPDRVVSMDVPEKVAISGTSRTVLYLYTVPARIAGRWNLALPGTPTPLHLAIEQDARGATARVQGDAADVPIPEFRVHGNEVSMRIPASGAWARPLALTGRVRGDAIAGTTDDGAPWRAERGR